MGIVVRTIGPLPLRSLGTANFVFRENLNFVVALALTKDMLRLGI